MRPLPEHLKLTDFLSTPDVFVWLNAGCGAVGSGRALEFTPQGGAPLSATAQWWKRVLWQQAPGSALSDLSPPAPRAFVSLPFDPANSVDPGGLVVPEVTLCATDEGMWLIEVGAATLSSCPSVEETINDHFVCDVPAAEVATYGSVAVTQGQLNAEQWRAAVAATVDRINAQDFTKAVLARDSVVCSTKPWHPGNILQQLVDRYPRCWTYAWDGLYGATPELLLRQDHKEVMSRVLAGSIPQTGNPRADFVARGQLSKSTKDQHEHVLAVDSVEQAFAAHQLSLTGTRSHVIELRNVAHLATDIHAACPPQFSVLDLAASLHPTAAVGGTPRHPATEWIRTTEHLDRGRYAGPIGWVGADGHGELGIALRCGKLLEPSIHGLHRMQLFAGCGIVAGSDPDAELAESEAKFAALRDILTTAPPAAS